VLAGVAGRLALDAAGRGIGGLGLGLLADGAVLVILSGLLGIVSRDDGRWLRDTAGGLFGGRAARALRWIEVR
jgi:hypothetical protein